ncbi:MAG: Hsp33 family molecular chaperone HslO [Pseudomonadota bacterium]
MSELHTFIFDGMPVRGRLVRLTGAWQEVLQRRKNAPWATPVRHLLGEMAAAATLMQSSIQFNGALVLQLVGDGNLKLAVAEVQPDLAFRVTATVVGEVSEDADFAAVANPGGKGRCAITLDARDRLPGQAPYQGVVPLHGDQGEPLTRLSDVLSHYMLQSEQLDTTLVLAANDQMAAGLLIQRMPTEGEGNLARREDDIGLNEDYNRISQLAATLRPEELLGLDAETVLRRLFWEEPVRRFEPVHPRFECRCSRERVSQMLRSLGADEVHSILEEQGRIDVACEFCGLGYGFDAVDAEALFSTVPPLPGSGAVH